MATDYEESVEIYSEKHKIYNVTLLSSLILEDVGNQPKHMWYSIHTHILRLESEACAWTGSQLLPFWEKLGTIPSTSFSLNYPCMVYRCVGK